MKVGATVRGAAHRSIHHTIRRTEVSDMHRYTEEVHAALERVTLSVRMPTAITERRRFALTHLGAIELLPTDTGVMHGPLAGQQPCRCGSTRRPTTHCKADHVGISHMVPYTERWQRAQPPTAVWHPHRVPGTTRTV
jgi:hypothetical protein